MTKLIEQLKRHEGLKLKPYKCTADKLTIGYGRNLEAFGISKEEAERMLVTDVARVSTALSTHGWFKGLDDVRKAVVVNMGFNLGVRGLLNFKNMIAAIVAGDYEQASKEMLDSRWSKQVGARAFELAEQMASGAWVV